MTEPKRRPRRGARAAKKAERAAPLAFEERAVNPGMTGGRFAPLNEADVGKVNDAVMDVLQNIGLSQAIPTCVDAVKKVGGIRYAGKHQNTIFRSVIQKCTLVLQVQRCILLMSTIVSIATQP